MAKKVFYNVEVAGYYPVGFAAVIVADSIEDARERLIKKLGKMGLLRQDTIEKVNNHTEQLSTSVTGVYILVDGNY